MRSAGAIVAYLAFILLGGSLLAPWLWWAVHWLPAEFLNSTGIAGVKFHRFVNRSFLICALAGLWPFLRALRVNSWSSVGLRRRPGWGLEVGSGVALSLGMLGAVSLVACLAGARRFQFDLSGQQLLKHLFNAGASAVAVGLLEELFFRGAIFGALRRDLFPGVALLASSVVYAFAHFFQPPLPPVEVTWVSGFEVLPQMLRGFGDLPGLVPEFFNLAIVGAVFALAFHRTGAIWFSIGLHAGLVFWTKTYGFLTRPVVEFNSALWGGGRVIDGWLALLPLVVLFVILLKWRPQVNGGAVP